MKKTSFITKLAIVGLMCTVFASNASADHKLGSYFQAVVLSQEQSPDLDVSVGRYSMNKGTVNVSSSMTRKPINRMKKGWGGKKKTNKKSVMSSPKKKRKPPMTTKLKNETLDNMGMKPLGYWAKEFERFVD